MFAATTQTAHAVHTATSQTLLGISDAGWSAVAAWVGLILAVIAAFYAARQFKTAQKARKQHAEDTERAYKEADRIQKEDWQERQRLRDEEAQPYVVVYSEPAPGRPHVVDLVVKNLGATAAKDVSIQVEPMLFRHAGGNSEPVELPEIIRTLVPGQEWRTFWDRSVGTTQLHMDPHTATVKFSDSRDQTLGPYTFVLDWSHISGRMFPSPNGLPELAKAVGEIRDVLQSWKRNGNDALRIHAYNGAEEDTRRREWFEQRQREHQDQQHAQQQKDQHGDERQDGEAEQPPSGS